VTPQQFIAKWQRAALGERSACQQHFLDLCELLDQPKPAAADPLGTWYTFEKGVETTEDKMVLARHDVTRGVQGSHIGLGFARTLAIGVE
jgi:hypothetical protein